MWTSKVEEYLINKDNQQSTDNIQYSSVHGQEWKFQKANWY